MPPTQEELDQFIKKMNENSFCIKDATRLVTVISEALEGVLDEDNDLEVEYRPCAIWE